MSDAVAVIEKPRELSVVEVKAQVLKVQNLMHDLMQDGTHYGESFPGDTKKNLLKPGADKLCFMFRLRPDFTQEIKELPNAHMEVLTRCQIFHIESGQKIADGVGLATTMESKYRWRNSARKCPVCGKETIIKGKEEYGGGFICFAKKGGCGAKFNEDDPEITEQIVGKVENPDIADTYNTVIKMSKKRAYVDATITACAASDIFSQDAEDFKDTDEIHEKDVGDPVKRDSDVKPEIKHIHINEAIELQNLLDSGKLGFLSKAAATAIQGNDINTIKGLLNSYKTRVKPAETATEKQPSLKNELQRIAQGVPAMYEEQDDGFKDDMPETTQEQQEIF